MVGIGAVIVNRIVRESLIDIMRFEKGEVTSHVDTLGENTAQREQLVQRPGSGNVHVRLTISKVSEYGARWKAGRDDI